MGERRVASDRQQAAPYPGPRWAGGVGCSGKACCIGITVPSCLGAGDPELGRCLRRRLFRT